MGAVPKKSDSGEDNDLAVQENVLWEQKGVEHMVVAGGQGLGSSEEEESRINEANRHNNNGLEGGIQVSSGTQKIQSQGSVIHWERFLPIRSLKVLLVENDDSTRHVVSALLRNCSYEVTAVANGLQAWKILEDLNNHIDLVLTEVVLPFLSGIGLLYKIINHKTLKNIPVIMMSCHDSMGLVFKCLSKGAVDFLVKPIRKNELKNLWQHVWRRCHSSSGSGSESGTGAQTKKTAASESYDESEKNSGSSDEHDNGSTGLSIHDGSDNGSGTQSSWTKKAAEIDSPQQISPRNQLADAPDSTCAQFIHTKPETSSGRWVHVTETKEYQEQDEQLAVGKDLEIDLFRDPDSQPEYRHKFSTHPSAKRQSNLSEPDYLPNGKENHELKSENVSGKPRDYDANLSSAVASCTEPKESRVLEAPSGISNVSRIKDKASGDFRESPSLELSLKMLRGTADVGTSMHGDRNVLRHSDLSAFSKYNTSFSTNQAPKVNVESSSPINNSSVAMKAEAMHDSNCTPNQHSNESSNNNVMSSSTNYAKTEAFSDKSESISALQPVPAVHVSTAQQVKPGRVDDVTVNIKEVQERGSNQQVQVHHHHHHYHHHHHHVHNTKHQPQQDLDNLSLKNMAAAAPQCGSTNMVGGSVEGNGRNYSANGSASGSNHGSNEQNRSSNALNAGVSNMGSDNGAAGKSGVGLSGRVGGDRADEDRFAQREAALTKFRQKRKERCFEKKVRYQSRKRLAEQRPRVRGQFVRQAVSDKKVGKDRQDYVGPKDKSSDGIQ